MTTERCRYEHELLDALGRGYLSPDVEEHVATCEACSELRLVAGALLDDRSAAMLEAPIPSAGTMWWRLKARQRHDAEAAARRTLVIGQAFTVALALGLVIAFFGASLADEVRGMAWSVATLHLPTPVLLFLAAALVITPITGWMATRQE